MKKQAQDPTAVIFNMYNQIYDPNDKAGSLSKFMGPVVVMRLMGAMGFGFYGALVGILMSAFDVDIVAIIKKITDTISSAVSGGKDNFTAEEINSVVESGFEQGFGKSKIANMNVDEIIKTAGSGDGFKEFLSSIVNDKSYKSRWGAGLNEGSKNVLVRVFSKIFTVLLGGMGLMIAGQGVKALMGKKNVFTDNDQKEKSETTQKTVSKPLKYKIKDSASKSEKSFWQVPVGNDVNEISRFVLKCIRNSFEVDNVSDNELTRSPIFDEIVSDINIYNSRMPTDKAILMPPEYKNELTVAYPIIKSLS